MNAMTLTRVCEIACVNGEFHLLQLESIRSQSTMSSGDLDRMRGESRNYRMQMEELSGEVSKLQAQVRFFLPMQCT